MVSESNVQYGDPGHPIDRRISNESSIQHQDYEIVAEFNAQYGDSKPPPLHQSISKEESTEDHSAKSTEYEVYSALHRDPSAAFAQPSVYTKLHLYANLEL